MTNCPHCAKGDQEAMDRTIARIASEQAEELVREARA